MATLPVGIGILNQKSVKKTKIDEVEINCNGYIFDDLAVRLSMGTFHDRTDSYNCACNRNERLNKTCECEQSFEW